MNLDLQQFSVESLAVLPLVGAKKISPAADELERMPVSLGVKVVDSAQTFDLLMPRTMTIEEVREFRQHVNDFCKYVFAGGGEVIEAKTIEELQEKMEVESNIQGQRMFSILEMGELSWEELSRDGGHDPQWDMLGLGNLDEKQRKRLHWHICAILKTVKEHEFSADEILTMIGCVEMARTAQRVFRQMQRALVQVAEFYEDCTDWNEEKDTEG